MKGDWSFIFRVSKEAGKAKCITRINGRRSNSKSKAQRSKKSNVSPFLFRDTRLEMLDGLYRAKYRFYRLAKGSQIE